MDRRDIIYQLHAEICKALAHPKRLEILDLLRDGEHTVEEIAGRVSLQKSNLSQHLAVLRKVHLVSTRREGLYVHYRLADERISQACDLIKQVLAGSLARSRELVAALGTPDVTPGREKRASGSRAGG